VFFVGALLAVLVVGTVLLGILEWRGHRRYLRRYARRRGWQWQARGDEPARGRTAFGPFTGKHRINSVMTFAVRNDVRARACQVVSAPGGKLFKKVRHWVIMIVLPAPVPFLTVRPEPRAGRSGRDVQFEWQEFNDAWEVHGEDRRVVHAVINGRMMEWLMNPSSRPRRLTDSFVLDGEALYTFGPGGLDATTIERRANELVAFTDQVPEFLWSRSRAGLPRRPGA